MKVNILPDKAPSHHYFKIRSHLNNQGSEKKNDEMGSENSKGVSCMMYTFIRTSYHSVDNQF